MSAIRAQSAHAPSAPGGRPAPGRRTLVYWLATGAFCVLFLGSAILSFATPEETRRVTEFLEYPAWTVFPLATAKLLGVVTIVWGRFQTLVMFAFAGFLYDLVLATGSHLAQDDPDVALALVGLVLWVAAFAVHRLGWRDARLA